METETKNVNLVLPKFRVWAETDDGTEMVYLKSGEYDNGLWFQSPKHISRYIDVMQFSGMKDCDGKEIYAKDILQFHLKEHNVNIRVVCLFGNAVRTMDTGYEVDIPSFYFLRMNDEWASFPIRFNDYGMHDLEVLQVIGNVWENRSQISDNIHNHFRKELYGSYRLPPF